MSGLSSLAPRRPVRFTTAFGTIALGGLLAASSVSAAPCQFAPPSQLSELAQTEPQMLIDGTCTDPDYNESTFVITNTEQLTFEVPGGPTIPYTQITGHFPARNTLATLPAGIYNSPTLNQHNVVLRFPAKEFWRNRSMQVQHPSSPASGNTVGNRLAFTNGAFSVNVTPGNPNATHRVHAGATKVARALANKLYGNTARIYSYYWGLSGGGSVAIAATEGTTGVWDGIQVQAPATNALNIHSFQWQGHFALAVPRAKRAAIAAARLPGSGLDVYAGLNEEEKSVLNELLAGGHPLNALSADLRMTPPFGQSELRRLDPTYEEDFWTKPGYAGANPPAYLAAAKVDGFATIAGITRNAEAMPTAIQLDPATVPAMGSIGTELLQFYVMAADGKTRVEDFNNPGNRVVALTGTLNPVTGALALTGTNSAVLLDALAVGGKIRVTNRFNLAYLFYPRHSIMPGNVGYNQYRNADGSPKYPQRAVNTAMLAQVRTMGGFVETGAIRNRTMNISNLSDAASYPYVGAHYAEQIERTIGPAKANDMLRLYLSEQGGHNVAGVMAGIFTQSLIDMMVWAEQGIAPKPSTRYALSPLTQVILPPNAPDRRGLQPVIQISANGADRAVVGVNQPVKLAAELEMPPTTGQIVQYTWSVDGADEAPTIVATPRPRVDVNRTMTFATPGTYVVRVSVNGQRDGLIAPDDQTLVQNYKEVRVVVTGPFGGGGERGK